MPSSSRILRDGSRPAMISQNVQYGEGVIGWMTLFPSVEIRVVRVQV